MHFNLRFLNQTIDGRLDGFGVRALEGAAASDLGLEAQARWNLAIALSVCVSLGVAFLSQTAVTINGQTYFSLADDVMISMTYARNLTAGDGLTWFPGETPVEGFTNPLWTLWLAFVHLLAPDATLAPLFAALSGLGAQVAGILGVDALSRRLGAGNGGRFFAVLSAAMLYAPTFWALRGFEVSVVMAIQTWMLVVALDFRHRGLGPAIKLGALASLAFLTRMDSLVVTSVIIAVRLLKPDRRALTEVAIAGGLMLAAAAALEAFRFVYFGDFLPNTAYLKLSNVPAMVRLKAGLASAWHGVHEWMPLGFLAVAALAARLAGPASMQNGRAALLAVLAVVGVQFAYSVFVGGDAWEWSGFANRFVSTVAYPLCAAAGLGVTLLLTALNLSRRGAQLAAALLAIATATWTSMGGWIDTFEGRGFQFYEEKYLIASGVALKDATPEGFSYALTWAGAIPYYADGRRPVDLLGKMDPAIAHIRPNKGAYKPGHNKYNLDHSIGKLRPDAMLQPPTRLSSSGGIRREMSTYGYVRTEGGWWITPAAMATLRDKAILGHAFWWDGRFPDLKGEAPPKLDD